MKHSKCGLLLVIAAAGLAACGGDPTGSIKETDPQIVADPGALFLNQGANIFVTAELRDAQGNQLPADIQVTNVGAGVTVDKDTTFLETTNGSKLPNRERFIVTATEVGASSFTLASGGTTLDIPVKVTPTAIPASFSTLTPAINEPVTVTAENYKFDPSTAAVVIGADSAVVIAVAADSSSLTFLPFPGSRGTPVISGALINFLPTAPLTLTSTDTVTVPTSPLAGTDAPATAPLVATPTADVPTFLFDSAGFGAAVCGGNSGAPCQLYKFTVAPGDTAFDATLNWYNGADLGLYVLSADGNTDTGQSCDAGGNAAGGAGFTEACTIALPPGDYLLAVVSFAPFYDPPDTEPTFINLQLVVAASETGGS
jgi:hypothetical protein